MINILAIVGGILGILFVICLEQYQKFRRVRNHKKMCIYENGTIFFGFISVGILLIAVLLM